MRRRHKKIRFILFLIILISISIITVKFLFPYLTIEYISNAIQNQTSEMTLSILSNISTFNSESVLTPNENDYAYNQLDENEQKIYKIFLSGIVNFQANVLIPSVDIDRASKIFNSILADYPELFWVDTSFSMSSQLINSVNISYIYNKEEAEKKQAEIDTVVNNFLSTVDSGLSDYDKVLKAYTYVIRNTDYNLEAPDNQNIISVFIGKKSVCSGYSKALQYLLKKMDIPSTYIIGEIPQKGSHGWNMVLLDGDYYFVDATWGDPIFENPEDSDPNHVSYEYFLITTDELLKTHKPINVFDLPIVTATKYNYYVYNDLFFDKYDFDKISDKIISDGVYGEKYIELKFSNSKAYNSTVKALITNEEIFNILDNTPNKALVKDSYNYSLDETKLIICFKLKYT